MTSSSYLLSRVSEHSDSLDLVYTDATLFLRNLRRNECVYYVYIINK